MNRATCAITVVGLGPGDLELITPQTMALLRDGRVFLRTRVHPTLETMPESGAWSSFDDFYERLDSFDAVYAAIVEVLLREAETGPIVYAVPGHPLFGEATVRLLLERGRREEVAVRVVPAVSFLDTLAPVLGIDPVDANLQLIDALELVAVGDAEPYAGGRMPLSPLRPAIVAQIYSPLIASAVKLTLSRLYPEEHEVTLVTASGCANQRVDRLKLVELDRSPVDHLSSLYIPALDPLSHDRVAEGLQQIVARLRAPGGCPWDREQTHDSLTRHMLEEAHEAIHAIESGSSSLLAEELGDVLLQVFLHAQIAEEAAEFSLEDVIGALTAKLVRRHPHVFGERTISTAGEVVRAWDQIKQDERRVPGTQVPASPFESIPPTLPALAWLQTMLRRARSHQIDLHIPPVRGLAASDDRDESMRLVAEQLAAIVAMAEAADVDAEQALRRWSDALIHSSATTSQESDDG
jgi:tetrapyrrole methylase family protein/MazG family protein